MTSKMNYLDFLNSLQKITKKEAKRLLLERNKINLEEFKELDYDALNFKGGLEIHQQLDTSKLFCECKLSDDSYDFEVKRKLYVSYSELNELDYAAIYEVKKDKTYIYRGNSNNVCLVELDDEPPHPLNQEALEIALQCAKLLNAKIIDEIQVMRKTVLDGSNTSGFQRTALIAYDGKIEDVKIETICLEEDSAKIIEKKDDCVIYHLNRLGVPLIEIATDASIKNPQHLKHIAKEIGLTLRSLKVKRGLGTIRQDLNISILNGNRVEIKGAQDLKNLDTIAKNEVIRQLRLNELKYYLNTIVNKKEVTNNEVLDLTEKVKGINNKIIQNAIKKDSRVFALKINNFANVFSFELLPNLRFGSELAGISKLFNLKGLFHCDELRQLKYGFTKQDIDIIENAIDARKSDGYIIIAGKKEQLEFVFEMIKKRIYEAFDGVVKEVRKVNSDLTTSFLRPMPGAARMYPETDVLPIKTRNIKILPVEHLKDKIKRYEEKLPKDMAEQLALNDENLFDEFCKEFNIKPTSIAQILIEIINSDKVESLSQVKNRIEVLLKYLEEEKINMHQIRELIGVIHLNSFEQYIEEFINVDKNALFKEIGKKIESYLNQGFNEGKIISLIMNEYKTKYNPKNLLSYVKEKIKKSK